MPEVIQFPSLTPKSFLPLRSFVTTPVITDILNNGIENFLLGCPIVRIIFQEYVTRPRYKIFMLEKMNGVSEKIEDPFMSKESS